jgi:hypothetical protein
MRLSSGFSFTAVFLIVEYIRDFQFVEYCTNAVSCSYLSSLL